MKIVKLVDLEVDKEFEGGEVGDVCISGYQFFERTAYYGLIVWWSESLYRLLIRSGQFIVNQQVPWESCFMLLPFLLLFKSLVSHC